MAKETSPITFEMQPRYYRLESMEYVDHHPMAILAAEQLATALYRKLMSLTICLFKIVRISSRTVSIEKCNIKYYIYYLENFFDVGVYANNGKEDRQRTHTKGLKVQKTNMMRHNTHDANGLKIWHLGRPGRMSALKHATENKKSKYSPQHATGQLNDGPQDY